MDKSDFDAFTRLLTNPGSRRTTLAALGGMIGVLGWQGASDVVLARKHKKKNKKRRGTSPPPLSVECPTGYTACGTQCFDLSDNPSNCGACAVVCSPNKTCCSGVCVDVLDNDSNCSACGQVCLPSPTSERVRGAVCINGTCEFCVLQGPYPPETQAPCCRGLVHCSSQNGTVNDCRPAGTCNI
jgi:hypothetical protein